jgi:hypothetical protein
MKEIPLTQGKVALVDDDDFEKVMSVSPWYAHRATGGKWYARHRVNGTRKWQSLQRFILGLDCGNPLMGDHKDRNDTLNCTKGNLRIATHQQNNCNRGRQKSNKSGFVGVSWHPPVR